MYTGLPGGAAQQVRTGASSLGGLLSRIERKQRFLDAHSMVPSDAFKMLYKAIPLNGLWRLWIWNTSWCLPLNWVVTRMRTDTSYGHVAPTLQGHVQGVLASVVGQLQAARTSSPTNSSRIRFGRGIRSSK